MLEKNYDGEIGTMDIVVLKMAFYKIFTRMSEPAVDIIILKAH